LNCRLAVVEGLVCLYDPENSAGGGSASGRYNHAGKINGERPDKRAANLFYTRNFDEVASLALPVDGNGLKSLLLEIHFVINIEKHCN